MLIREAKTIISSFKTLAEEVHSLENAGLDRFHGQTSNGMLRLRLGGTMNWLSSKRLSNSMDCG